MKAFISLGFYDIREQELLSSRSIRGYLLENTLECIGRCPGVELQAILCSQLPGEPLPDCRVPVLRLHPQERTRAELDAIRECGGEGTDWVLVLRPGQGGLFPSRVEHFHAALASAASSLAASTILFTPVSHPMWNVLCADRRFHANGAIRQPRSGTLRVRRLNELCPELWQAMEEATPAEGSQHLKALHHCDQALYAARPGLVPPGTDLREALPIPCPHEESGAENILLRLPIFQMSREQVIDVSALERLLEKLERVSHA